MAKRKRLSNPLGANASLLPLSDGSGRVIQKGMLHRLVDPLRRIAGLSSSNPEVRFDCIDATLEWISEMDEIIGCQYFLTHPDIVEALLLKRCRIIIEHHDWMDLASARTKMWQIRSYKLAKSAYPKFNWVSAGHLAQTDISEVLATFPDLPTPLVNGMGIGVFRHIPLPGDYMQEMHHKFFVGTKNDGRKSVLYGSFNCSINATKNLDSVLIFNDNNSLCSDLEREFLLLLKTNQVSEWNEFSSSSRFVENDREYPDYGLPIS